MRPIRHARRRTARTPHPVHRIPGQRRPAGHAAAADAARPAPPWADRRLRAATAGIVLAAVALVLGGRL